MVGDAALELVHRLAPDVVVMDIQRPGVDGIQATREVSAHHPQAIVVGFTDSDETGVEEAICQAGAVRHFHNELGVGAPGAAAVA